MQIDKLINAINKLKKDSKPKWGRMNSSQMLWHCNKFVIFYLNEKNILQTIRHIFLVLYISFFSNIF